MFCTHLRNREPWASIVPRLSSPSPGRSTAALRETTLESHDICLALPHPTGPAIKLRILLTSPDELPTPTATAALRARIARTLALNAGANVLLIFLAHSATRDPRPVFLALQSELNFSLDDPVPVFPLSSPAHLPTLLRTLTKSHLTASSLNTPPEALGFNPIRDLLPAASTTAPMPEHAAYVLSDLFTGLADLVRSVDGDRERAGEESLGIGARSEEGGWSQRGDRWVLFKELVERDGCGDAGEMVDAARDFWRKEYVSE